jgi:hypothetical protein
MKLSEAARTLTRSSFSLGTGFSTSATLRTSGDPYSQYLIAFMRSLREGMLRPQSLVEVQ